MQKSTALNIVSLNNESEKFRKAIIQKWKKALVGEYTIKDIDQDFLIHMLRYLVDIAFGIEEYSMKMPANPKAVDKNKVQAYLNLIEAFKKLIP